MGSYSTLYINGKEICSRKHELDESIMTLFQSSERNLCRGTIAEIASDLLDEDRENADELIELLKYETTVDVLRDRLDLMGYSIQLARKEFDSARKEVLDEMQGSGESEEERLGNTAESDSRQRAIVELTFERWLTVLSKVWNQAKELPEIEERSTPLKNCSLDELLLWYVRSQSFDSPYSFPLSNIRLFIRVVCEVISEDSSVVYDLSELAFECGDAEGLAAFAESYLDGGYATTRRIIVLTEGRTDQRAIEGALKLLRPGLANYFSFLDFETLAVPGGATSALNILKALVSVGIANRVIALLDNDTAANAAVQTAKLGALPNNARVVFLPHLQCAVSYPTHGPTGMTNMDINELACSVELYFGVDILSKLTGELMPIQWKGYDEKLKRYQGEVMRKADLQSLFSLKLREAKENPAIRHEQDWAPMQMVIERLITAFHDMPPLDYGMESSD